MPLSLHNPTALPQTPLVPLLGTGRSASVRWCTPQPPPGRTAPMPEKRPSQSSRIYSLAPVCGVPTEMGKLQVSRLRGTHAALPRMCKGGDTGPL